MIGFSDAKLLAKCAITFQQSRLHIVVTRVQFFSQLVALQF